MDNNKIYSGTTAKFCVSTVIYEVLNDKQFKFTREYFNFTQIIGHIYIEPITMRSIKLMRA